MTRRYRWFYLIAALLAVFSLNSCQTTSDDGNNNDGGTGDTTSYSYAMFIDDYGQMFSFLTKAINATQSSTEPLQTLWDEPIPGQAKPLAYFLGASFANCIIWGTCDRNIFSPDEAPIDLDLDEIPLPRGAFDLDNETTGTPTAPYDLSLKWSGIQAGESYRFDVDWDANGVSTILTTVKTQTGTMVKWERPQKAEVVLLHVVDNYEQKVLSRQYNFIWEYCKNNAAYADRMLGASADVVMRPLDSTLNYEAQGAYATKASLDSSKRDVTSTAEITYSSPSEEIIVKTQLQWVLNNQNSNADCIEWEFQADLTEGLQVNLEYIYGSKTLRIEYTQTLDAQKGILIVKGSMYAGTSNTLIATLEGELFQTDIVSCPADLTIRFQDGSEVPASTLERDLGYCPFRP